MRDGGRHDKALASDRLALAGRSASVKNGCFIEQLAGRDRRISTDAESLLRGFTKKLLIFNKYLH